MQYVIIPGIEDSGVEHWQSIWQDAWGQQAVRIAPVSWSRPDWSDWQDAISAVVDDGPAVLVAHSLGCLAAAGWLRDNPGRALGFLVAVPDPRGPRFPAAAVGFDDPGGPLRSAALVVASSDDPYATPTASRRIAEAWGASWVDVGALGHVNSASGHGPWPDGRARLEAFTADPGRAGAGPQS